MSEQLFNLSRVPEDEADEIRELLDENSIEYYETAAGNWGVSLPAIWLSSDEQLEQAKALIDVYQLERTRKAQELYRQQKLDGTAPDLITNLKNNPVQILFYLGATLLVLYISIMPFINW